MFTTVKIEMENNPSLILGSVSSIWTSDTNDKLVRLECLARKIINFLEIEIRNDDAELVHCLLKLHIRDKNTNNG